MYDVEKALQIYKTKLKQDNAFAEKIVKHWKDKMPQQFARYMYEQEYGCHIVDNDMYNQSVSYLKWYNNQGTGAKWETENILKLVEFDFEECKFTKLDFSYIVNMLYADYCGIISDSDTYIEMAEVYLTDPDYPGKAEERAYHDACKRIKYYEHHYE